MLNPNESNLGRPGPSAALGIVPVVMSGGSGTRLWPLSTEDAPKQFHPLGSARTMLQDTVLRLRAHPTIAFAPPIVVCNRRHRALVQAQLRAIGIEPSAIVLEPFGRNTAAVAVIAAELAAALHLGMRVLLMPADHVIADEAAFAGAISRGALAKDRIVTFGIEPASPHTGYGYIQRGDRLGDGVFKVVRFAEKPSKATAEAYLAQGGYYWNSGIFLFAPKVMLAEFGVHRPDILHAATAALAGARRAGVIIDLPDDLFAKVPSESLDVAVMEATRLAAVAPCDAGWADVGSWGELWRLGPHDGQGNRAHGDAVMLDTHDSLVWAEGVTVGVVGLKDMIVVAAHGAVLVLPRSRAESVKSVVEQLKAMKEAGAKKPAGPGPPAGK
jgi:mannose-1-phosphate guanylyltransferase/mannose-6-phosphate isomerase